MDPGAFEELAREELAHVPPRFARRIANVAILIEEAPSAEVLREEGLGEGEILLGLYRGTPASSRGAFYSGVLPDTITLYRLPLMEEAGALLAERRSSNFEGAVRLAIRETLWHELGHHFGLSEEAVEAREAARSNQYGYAQPGRKAASPKRPHAIMTGALHSRRLARRDRLTSLIASMAKTLAVIFGILLVLAGLLGFVGNPLVGANAVFVTDAIHNLVHLVLGLALLAAGLSTAPRAAAWLKVVGVISLVIGVLGLLLVSGTGSLLGLVEVNGADNWLHIVLGIVLIAAGYMAKGESTLASPMPAAPATPTGGMGAPPAPPSRM